MFFVIEIVPLILSVIFLRIYNILYLNGGGIMLKKFEVERFKNFENKFTLDL